MTKTEQTRVTAWRLKILYRAAADTRQVARTCRHFGRKTFHNGNGATPNTAPPACVTGRGAHTGRPEPRRRGRVSIPLPLARGGPRDPACVHPPADAASQWQGRTVTSDRRSGVLPAARQDGITDDIHLFNEKLREWENYDNYDRPHGALDGQTPYERLLAKTRAVVAPAS
jgi:hypothetical protein